MRLKMSRVPPMSKDKKRSGLIETGVIVALALGLALAIQAWVVKPYQIPSGSMEPTLDVGQRILVNRFVYHFTDPKIGDIKPLLATDMQHGAAIGPGGQDIVVSKKGETWIVFHSWDPSTRYRRMMLEQLVWEGDTPVVKGPDRGPQPRP